jgi:uncharacterized protein YbjT (DUF2867 family)
MTRILVTGATGTQGGSVVDHLLGEGPGVDASVGPVRDSDGDPVAVRGLTRTKESQDARRLAERGVDVLEGDLTDRAAIDRALSDVDVLFLVLAGDADTQRRQAETTIPAAVDAGLDHVILSTGGGADEAPGIPHVDAKHDAERRLRESGLEWTILGPHSFMSNFERQRGEIEDGRLAFPIPEGMRFPIVDPDDIGRLTARIVADPARFAGERIELAGEAATLEELAATFADVLGRPVDPVRPPADATPAGMRRFLSWLASLDTAGVPDRLRREFDFDPRTLSAYLRRTGWGDGRATGGGRRDGSEGDG